MPIWKDVDQNIYKKSGKFKCRRKKNDMYVDALTCTLYKMLPRNKSTAACIYKFNPDEWEQHI